MHFYYIDPGLMNNIGHHANSCRFITGELRRRGIPTTIFAHSAIEPELRSELSATPLFKVFTYFGDLPDDISGWLNVFDVSWTVTFENLRTIRNIGRDDMVFLNSARPAQLMAVGEWLNTLDPNRRPVVAVEFGTEPGAYLTVENGHNVLRVPEVHVDSRPLLFRFAAKRITQFRLPRFHMVTYEQNCSAIYSALLEHEVGVLPWPHYFARTPRSRVGKRPIVVSFLGHQRPDKGYQLVPAIAKALLANRNDIRLLIHNAKPDDMADVQEEIRRIARDDVRVAADERTADAEIWDTLMDESDIVVCPYLPPRYATSHSTVMVEAIARGIPVVVPNNTVLSRSLEELGGPGTTFTDFAGAAITDAIQRALDQFDDLAARAVKTSAIWAERNGPAAIVDALLRLAVS